jgi:hypothetical protein
MKKVSASLFSKANDCSFLFTLSFVFLLHLLFNSGVYAQTLCTQFQNTSATQLPINNGNSSDYGVGFVGAVLDLSGTFTVSGQFKFKQCTLRMAEDAIINVVTPAKFEMIDCKIFCCGKMWNGIKVTNLGWLELKQNVIEDAFVSIDVDNPIYCLILNNQFNSNDVSIRIRDYSGICRFGIAGNIFNGNFDDTMNEVSPFTGINNIAYIGIWLINCSGVVTIGLNNFPNNVFHARICMQISADNSRVCVQKSQFIGGAFSLSSAYPSGRGIYAQNKSNVCVHGLGTSDVNNFTFKYHSIAGIYTHNSTIKCYNSIFTQMLKHHIWCENTNANQFDIRNNYFFSNVNSLPFVGGLLHVISANKGTSGFSLIKYNKFDILDVKSVIKVTDSNNSNALLLIEDNSDNFLGNISFGGKIGIEVLSGNSSNNLVRNNKLLAKNNNESIGIHFTSATGGQPGNENRIQSNVFGGELQNFLRGINVGATPNALICGNHLLSAYTGVRLAGNCMNTQVGRNTFTGIGYDCTGLFLDGGGINLGINTNIHQGNTWSGSFASFSAAKHSGGDPQLSPFIANNNPSVTCGDPMYWPTSNGIPSATPNWFQYNAGCVNECGIQTFVGNGNEGILDALDSLIINGAYASTGQSPVSIWEAKYSEYRKLRDYSSAYGNNSFTNGFVSNLQGSAISKFYEFEKLTTEGLNFIDSIQENLNALYEDYDIQRELLRSSHEALMASPENQNLLAAYSNAVTGLNAIQNDIDQWLLLDSQEKTVKINQAETVNYQISPINNYEFYLQNINILRLKKYKGLSFTEQDILDIKGIAIKCYEEAGQAIYFARALLPDTLSYILPTDEECSEERSSHTPGRSKEYNKIFLYPNPVSSNLIISGLDSYNNSQFICQIYDAVGRLTQQNVVTGDGAVSFSGFSPGIYLLQLLSDGQVIIAQRIVKIAE